MALPFAGLTYIGLPEQAVGWFLLGLGLVVEDGPTELTCELCTFVKAESPVAYPAFEEKPNACTVPPN